jgi:hypothetical protein
MSKKTIKAPATQDPTLNSRVISTTQGAIRLSIDFGVLIDAEEELIALGYKGVNLLISLQAETASAVRLFFILASRRFHPELTPERAKELVTFENLPTISAAITDLWLLSMPKPKAESDDPDPTLPA